MEIAHRKPIPSREDINPYGPDYLDGEWAVRNFLGKYLDEVIALFLQPEEQHAWLLQEDFQHMGPKAFAYYFPAYLAYFRSPASDGDCESLSAVIMILEFRLEYEPESIALTAWSVREVLTHCIAHYDKFTVDFTIYGDIKARMQSLLNDLDRRGL